MAETLYELLNRCTIRIVDPASQEQGTGFFVAPGQVLTCAHVVKGANMPGTAVQLFWRPQAQGPFLTTSATVTANAPEVDLALLAVEDAWTHPCVWLGEEVDPFQELYSFGYPASLQGQGTATTVECEGWTETETQQLLAVKAGQVAPGMSGSPLLNKQTGRVCGVLAKTKDAYSALGGRAVLTRTVLEVFPSLQKAQVAWQEQDEPWRYALEVHQGISITRQAAPIQLQASVPFQVPPLTPYFVPRLNINAHLKNMLLADTNTTPGTLRILAIQGLGGSGKSTLTIALTNDIEVRQRFPDGVFWFTLGQRPNLLALLSGWIQSLGDYNFHAANEEIASSHLRSLLQHKAILLVLDDAWDLAYIRLFLVGGPRCYVVITTRDALIAKAVGAVLYNLEMMTSEQALALLTSRLGHPLEKADQEYALELARAIGYLPLALELAAVQVAEGISWNELLADIQAEVALLETFDIPGGEEVTDEVSYKRLSLLGSLNLSLRRLPADRRRAFAWLGVLYEDVNLTRSLAAIVWEVNESLALVSLRYFHDKALLSSGTALADGTPAYRIHDVLHDMARRLLVTPPEPNRASTLAGLGLTIAQAHTVLLQRYQARTRSGLWHTLPNDGYISTYLPWHLERAGRIDELHSLLREETSEGTNGWYQLHDRIGQTANYITHVMRAWQVAEQTFTNTASPQVSNEETKAPEKSRSIGLQIRYALILASLNSLAKNIHPALLVALVKNEIWSSPQAFAYACQVPNQRQRADALIGLAPHLREPMLDTALSMAWSMGSDRSYLQDDSTYALVGLIPHLSKPQLIRIVTNGRAKSSVSDRADILTAVVQRLVVLGDLEEALIVAREIPKSTWSWSSAAPRLEVLMELLPVLQGTRREEVQREVRRLIRSLNSAHDRVKKLTALVSHVPEALKIDVLEEAIEAANTIQGDEDRARALAELAMYFPASLKQVVKEQVLTIARTMKDATAQVHVLVHLAAHLQELFSAKDLQMALMAVRKIKGEEMYKEQASALIAMSPFFALLPKEEHDQVLHEALIATRKVQYDTIGEIKETITLRVSEGRTDWKGAQPLELVPFLPEPLKDEVRTETLRATQKIKHLWPRAWALIVLLSRLPAPLKSEAEQSLLATIQGMEAQNQVRILEELLPLVSEPKRSQVAKQALKVVQKIDSRMDQVNVLRQAVSLSESLRGEALTITRELRDATTLATILIALIQVAPDTEREQAISEALMTVLSIKNENERGSLLKALIPYLSESHLRKILLEARLIEDKDDRILTLAELSFSLSESSLQEVFIQARTIEDMEYRVRAMAKLAPHLPASLQAEAFQESLAAIRSLKENYLKKDAFIELAPPFIAAGYAEEVLAAMRSIEVSLSPQYLEETLAEVTIRSASSHPEVALSLVRVYEEETRNSPFLDPLKWMLLQVLPYFSEPLLQEARSMVQAIERNESRAEVLLAIASYVSTAERENVLLEAVEAAKKIDESAIRTDVFIAIVPQLSEPQRSLLLEEAVRLIRATEVPEDRVRAIVQAAPQLPEPQRSLLLKETLEFVIRKKDIRGLLQRAIPMLAPHLTEPLLKKALDAAREIEGPYERVEPLAELAHRQAELGYPQEAIATALELSDVGMEWESSPRVEGLKRLPSWLLELNYPEAAIQAALALPTSDMWSDTPQMDALAVLSPRLAEMGYYDKALAIAWLIESEKRLVSVLASLAPHLAKLPPHILFPLWIETLHNLASRTRKILLAGIRAFTPVTTSLGGTEAMVETIQAIQDLGCWWP